MYGTIFIFDFHIMSEVFLFRGVLVGSCVIPQCDLSQLFSREITNMSNESAFLSAFLSRYFDL